MGRTSTGELARRALTWAAVALLPVLGALLRLRAHPSHAFDEETSLSASAAREFVHGQLQYFPHFHFNLHQGSQLIDAFLAMPGFVVFGDHVLAWASVALFWVGVLGVSGGWLARRFAGWSGAWLYAGLLSVAPFLLKDGMLAMAGGHAPVAAWTLAALALAVAAREDPLPDAEESPRRSRLALAIAAGAVAATGAYYTRSVAIAWPAVVICLWPRPTGGDLVAEATAVWGSRRLRGALLALLLFPVLAVGTVASHFLVGTQTSRDHQFGAMVRRSINPITNMEDCSEYKVEQGICGDQDDETALTRKLVKATEVLGVKHIRHQFLQPDSMHTGRAHTWDGARRHLRDGAGLIWVLGYVLALPLLLLLVAQRRLAPLALLSALPALGYVAGYVGTGMRIEEPPDGWWPEVSTAPWPTDVRYLIPAWALLLLCLAIGLAVAWKAGGRLRLGAGVAGLALLGSGVGMTAWDVVVDTDPAEAFARFRPFRYFRNYASHRGPPRDAHTVCGITDPITRANRLRAYATWNQCDPFCIEEDPARAPGEIDWLVAQADGACPDETITAADRAFLAHGMGINFGAQAMVFNFEPIGATAARVWAAADALDDTDRRWFLLGVRDALFDYGEPMVTEERLALFCRPDRSGAFPLCPLVGLRECDPEAPEPAAGPQSLCAIERLDFSTFAPGVVEGIVFGAGRSIGHRLPPSDLSGVDWTGWSPELKQAWLDGWAEGGRFRWRQTPDPPEYRPDRVP